MEIKSENLSGVCDYSRLYLDQRHHATAATLNKQKLKFGMEEILGNIGEDKVNKHIKNNLTTTTTIVPPSPSVRNIFISTLPLIASQMCLIFLIECRSVCSVVM